MIPDVHITDWHVDPTQNVPTDGTFVGTDMPRQIRNIKSIVREEYQDRWEALPQVPTYVDATSFTVPNDGETTGFPLPSFGGFAMRFHAGIGTISYGYAKGVTLGTPTTVVVVMTQGVLPTTLARVDMGMIPESRAYHELGRRGTFTISGTAVSANVTFASIAMPPMPRANYQVMATLTDVTGTPPLSAWIVQDILTTKVSFQADLQAPPGAGASVKFDWAIVFPFQAVNV
jgi:hypothetical protein